MARGRKKKLEIADEVGNVQTDAPVNQNTTIEILFNCYELGQMVVKQVWNDDTTVLCPRCHKILLFDGEYFYDDNGLLYFWVDEKNNPGGHFFRYDLIHQGYVSPKFIGRPLDAKFDFKREFNEAVQKLGTEVAIGNRTHEKTQEYIGINQEYSLQNSKSRKSSVKRAQPTNKKSRKTTETITGKRRGRPPKVV